MERHLLALLALTSTACLTADEADHEEVVASELTGGLGDADIYHYSCVYPLCGGMAIKFDSRTLALRSCLYDARAGVLDCEAHAADSPRMPSAFFSAAAELTCADDLRFSCTATRDLLSCVCAAATATTTGVKYGPVLKVKPQG
jgi:hypothetical protein